MIESALDIHLRHAPRQLLQFVLHRVPAFPAFVREMMRQLLPLSLLGLDRLSQTSGLFSKIDNLRVHARLLSRVFRFHALERLLRVGDVLNQKQILFLERRKRGEQLFGFPEIHLRRVLTSLVEPLLGRQGV